MTLDDRQAAIALQVGQGRITLEVGRKRVFDTLHLPRSQSAALSGTRETTLSTHVRGVDVFTVLALMLPIP